MKRVFTEEGYDTHAWEVAFDIKKFIYDVTQKDVNYQQWHNLTSGDNAKKAKAVTLSKAFTQAETDISKSFSMNVL